MTVLFRRATNKAQRMLGIELKRRPTPLQSAWNALVSAKQFESGLSEEDRFLALCRTKFLESHSQLFQDIFVLFEVGMKRDGFFVEFGATDGDKLSNTYLLENGFDWRGILAEPAKSWHASLRQNRKCLIETRCVTAKTGDVVTFNETDWLELSTIDKWSSSDGHASQRSGGNRYQVQTISLNDLLEKNDAPEDFDYLSIDTEGSELEILQGFNFVKYRPSVITVEHNYTRNRKPIYEIITSAGYERKFEQLSMFDDWYVRR